MLRILYSQDFGQTFRDQQTVSDIFCFGTAGPTSRAFNLPAPKDTERKMSSVANGINPGSDPRQPRSFLEARSDSQATITQQGVTLGNGCQIAISLKNCLGISWDIKKWSCVQLPILGSHFLKEIWHKGQLNSDKLWGKRHPLRGI